MVGRCNVYSLSLFGVVEQRSPKLRYCHTLQHYRPLTSRRQ